MAITYENLAYDRVLKGVETILEAEFTNEVIVYLSDVYEEMPGRRSIRLWNLDSEEINPRTSSIVDLYPVEISCYVPISQRARRVVNDEMAELTAKIRRLLLNNRQYSPSGTYQWHDGQIDTTPKPNREDDEPGADVMSMSRLIYNVTVEEVI